MFLSQEEEAAITVADHTDAAKIWMQWTRRWLCLELIHGSCFQPLYPNAHILHTQVSSLLTIPRGTCEMSPGETVYM